MNLSCVMIIDDNEADQYFSKYIIEEYDPSIIVLQAYDGQEALDMLGSTTQRPDVIFLDINMPGMDGHEFLQAYEQEVNEKSIIVMLTSSEAENDCKGSLAYKCVKSYLVKPMDANNFDELRKLEQ